MDVHLHHWIVNFVEGTPPANSPPRNLRPVFHSTLERRVLAELFRFGNYTAVSTLSSKNHPTIPGLGSPTTPQPGLNPLGLPTLQRSLGGSGAVPASGWKTRKVVIAIHETQILHAKLEDFPIIP